MNINQIKNIIKTNLISIFNENDIKNITINDDTEIFGSKSTIDSLQLVNLIVIIEAEVLKQTGKEIIVVDDDVVISDESPFQTIQSLSEFVYKKVSESITA